MHHVDMRADELREPNANGTDTASRDQRHDMWQEVWGHRTRFFKTCCLYSSNVIVGLMTAIVGPTLLDLQVQVHSDVGTMAFLLTSRAAAHAVGAAASKFFARHSFSRSFDPPS